MQMNIFANPRAGVVLASFSIAGSAMLLEHFWSQIQHALGFAAIAALVALQAIGG